MEHVRMLLRLLKEGSDTVEGDARYQDLFSRLRALAEK
jgi:hypothetical protein